MFTGLVQNIGVIRSVDTQAGDQRIEVEVSHDVTSVQMGASVCCSGCCLTVVGKSKSSLFFDVSAETLRNTIIGSWGVMTRINLEPSLKMGDEMGGHIVSGHVDTVSHIMAITPEGDSRQIRIAIPQGYAGLIASKGSITIDGVSLTVNAVTNEYFDVNIIAHTWDNTTLGDRKAGDDINIEIDMLARYVARMLEQRA
tara:strand:- start:37834 stop:38427 length:594 start_codon:yes stop_codon:yes gene_type:complete